MGNVIVTISDKKLGKISNLVQTKAEYYEAIVKTASDYYPFGWQMPNRKLNTENYSFGFNGQIQDVEWNGGQSVHFKFRVHDPRLGRFLSVDPLAPDFPWNSPYAYAENDVIRSRDLEGAEAAPTNKGSTQNKPKCTGPKHTTSSTQRGAANANEAARSSNNEARSRTSPETQSRQGAKSGGNTRSNRTAAELHRGARSHKKVWKNVPKKILPRKAQSLIGILWNGYDIYSNIEEHEERRKSGERREGALDLDWLNDPEENRRVEEEQRRLNESFNLNKTTTQTDKQHGNSLDNLNPQIVYEIYVITPDNHREILKYGIGSQTSYPTFDGRPKLQTVVGSPLYLKYMLSSNNPLGEHMIYIDYEVLNHTANRREALRLEQQYVDKFYSIHGRMPYEQVLPIPTVLKKGP